MSYSMRSSSFLRCLPLSSPGTSRYICYHCRRRRYAIRSTSLSPSTVVTTRRNASTSREKTSATEIIRRKIWGSQEPLGQADPYGDASVLDRTKQRAQEPELPEPASAPTQDEAAEKAATHTDYVPATTWDGLDHIGGATGWWEEAWDEEHQFDGFMTTSKVGSVDAIKQAVRRAVVEVLTLKNARKRLTYATRMPVDEIVNISHFKFLKTANGTILMDFQGSKKQHDTLASIPNDSTVLGADTLSKMRANGEVSEEPSESIRIPRNISTSQDSNAEEPSLAGTTGTLEFEAVDDEIWMELSLEDQMMKFAVLKRVMQLTGRRVPDPTIDQIKVVGNLVEYLTEKPKPKKLAELLTSKPDLASMPNVQIFDRRHTPIDKEKEVGRWKVIERELQKRGLPVTGRS